MPHHLIREQLVRLLLVARSHSEPDFVMFLLTFDHALRESEVVGQKTTQRGQFFIRSQAELRQAEIPLQHEATVREVVRKIKGRKRTVYQVHVKKAAIVGGIRPESFRGGFLYVERLKGSRAVKHPLLDFSWLSQEIMERSIVEEFLRQHAQTLGGELLFPITRKTYWQRMQRYGMEAGIPEHLCHPHIFKHSIAKFLLRECGLQIDAVQGWLGHKSINSTGEYLKPDETEVVTDVMKAGMRQAVKIAHEQSRQAEQSSQALTPKAN